MKRNITINLFGSLYAIDEDAYELLKRYEENMRSYFRRKDSGKEIADDIEYRVAELLAEMKANGTEAIAIEHIEEIIRRIGNPEQMEGEEESDIPEDGSGAEEPASGHRGLEEMATRAKSWLRGRKLFRDTQDCMIGGVMSGLCHFFGGTDPLPWRIGMVLLCLFSFYTFAIVYLILWAFVPQARTAEERLQMHGRPVSAESINEELMRGLGKASEAVSNAAKSMPARGFLYRLVRFVMFCFMGAVFLGVCMLLFGVMMSIVLLAYSHFSGAEALVEYGLFDTETLARWNLMPGAGWLMWSLAGSLAVAAVITLYAIIRWMGKGETPMGSRTRVTLLLGWLAAVAVAVCSAIFFSLQQETAWERYKRQRNTHNGIFLSGESWEILRNKGWQVLDIKGCDPYIHSAMADPRTNDNVRVYRFEANDSDEPFRFHIRRSEMVQPGLYRLEALVDGNGYGGCVYAQLPSDSTRYHLAYKLTDAHLPQSLLRPEVPVYESSDADDIESWEELEYVVSDTLEITGGTVTYGVTNDSRVAGVPCNGNEFKLVAINLVRLGPPTERVHALPAAPASPAPQKKQKHKRSK